ncbi:MFS transporter, partial [Gluconacetobacter sacchari]
MVQGLLYHHTMIDPRILLLAFGTFAIGTEGYAIAGLLPMISADLHVSVAACGQLAHLIHGIEYFGWIFLLLWFGRAGSH